MPGSGGIVCLHPCGCGGWGACSFCWHVCYNLKVVPWGWAHAGLARPTLTREGRCVTAGARGSGLPWEAVDMEDGSDVNC